MCCELIRGDDKNRHVSICMPIDDEELAVVAPADALNGEGVVDS